MATSEGDGGYCDCGDAEAFTRDHICGRHAALNVTACTSADTLKKFPDDVKERARDLFHGVRKMINVFDKRDFSISVFF